jgi:hypothetical protein
MIELTVELLSATTVDDELNYFSGLESHSVGKTFSRLPSGRYMVLGGQLQPMGMMREAVPASFSREEIDPFSDFQPDVAPLRDGS